MECYEADTLGPRVLRRGYRQQQGITVRLLLAAVLGRILGYERERMATAGLSAAIVLVILAAVPPFVPKPLRQIQTLIIHDPEFHVSFAHPNAEQAACGRRSGVARGEFLPSALAITRTGQRPDDRRSRTLYLSTISGDSSGGKGRKTNEISILFLAATRTESVRFQEFIFRHFLI